MKNNLHENLFTTIAKILASAALNKQISKTDLERDMDLNTTIESFKALSDQFEAKLKSHCERYPQSSKCIDRKKK